jgi:hypothetical protein
MTAADPAAHASAKHQSACVVAPVRVTAVPVPDAPVLVAIAKSISGSHPAGAPENSATAQHAAPAYPCSANDHQPEPGTASAESHTHAAHRAAGQAVPESAASRHQFPAESATEDAGTIPVYPACGLVFHAPTASSMFPAVLPIGCDHGPVSVGGEAMYPEGVTLTRDRPVTADPADPGEPGMSAPGDDAPGTALKEGIGR